MLAEAKQSPRSYKSVRANAGELAAKLTYFTINIPGVKWENKQNNLVHSYLESLAEW